ncbi:hypothetical protein C8F04DRAFT_1088696 [Mycena alexandri]|uniref:F-box domain-containing protein n=1 Tax=Mycena alexandri TaxID=1745969 RepID=A0AAD6T510_9AGAR|nr:hypothetical protein C8F04DRAFT_1088696 [Mycena alexandri]
MPSVDRLVADLLRDIMLQLPSSIQQKFDFVQVSRFWRGVALDSPLFWSSFSGDVSTMTSHRLPLVLERSGSETMLHIEFWFPWHDMALVPVDALKPLVQYAARIESLDLTFPSVFDVALLQSHMDFPALRTLRLKAPEYSGFPPLALNAPQLRTLDFENIGPADWSTVLVATLDNIRLYNAADASVETLSYIFNRCPRAWRIVLYVWDSYYSDHTADYFEVFARRPLAPALQELELRLADEDLTRVLNTGFSDIVLPTVTASIYNGHRDNNLDILTGALLPGLGPLVVFQLLGPDQIELRDEAGRIRRLECWNDDSSFDGLDVWKYLSRNYALHKTVREIRISAAYWERYIDAFELYPPQRDDGITLGVELVERTSADRTSPRKMRLPGLARVEFIRTMPDSTPASVEGILRVLESVEPPTARKVEVCAGNNTFYAPGGITEGVFDALKNALSNQWVVCSHCA